MTDACRRFEGQCCLKCLGDHSSFLNFAEDEDFLIKSGLINPDIGPNAAGQDGKIACVHTAYICGHSGTTPATIVVPHVVLQNTVGQTKAGHRHTQELTTGQ